MYNLELGRWGFKDISFILKAEKLSKITKTINHS